MKKTFTIIIIMLIVGVSLYGQDDYFKRIIDNDKLTFSLEAEKNKKVVDITFEPTENLLISVNINENEILLINGKVIPSSGYQWSIVGMDDGVLRVETEMFKPILNFGATDERIVLKGFSKGITEFKLV